MLSIRDLHLSYVLCDVQIAPLPAEDHKSYILYFLVAATTNFIMICTVYF